MNIDYLTYLIELTENDFNVSQTAEKLFISQPALSKMIARLESAFQVELFTRDKRRLTGLTAAGKIVVDYSHRITNFFYLMQEDIYSLPQNMTGTIKIGVTTEIINVLFKNVFTEIILKYPTLNVTIIEDNTRHLHERFINDELDIYITIDRYDYNRIKHKSYFLYETEYVAIMNKDNVLADKQILKWSDLAAVNLALTPDGHLSKRLINHKLEKHHVKTHVSMEVSLSQMLIGATNDVNTITVLPKIYYENYNNDRLTYIPFEDHINWEVRLVLKQEETDEANIKSFIANKIASYFK